MGELQTVLRLLLSLCRHDGVTPVGACDFQLCGEKLFSVPHCVLWVMFIMTIHKAPVLQVLLWQLVQCPTKCSQQVQCPTKCAQTLVLFGRFMDLFFFVSKTLSRSLFWTGN